MGAHQASSTGSLVPSLSIDLMALHKEILGIQNSKLPNIHPGEVASRVLDELQGFNSFHVLRHSFWILRY
jgi:hypothetical protein